MAFPYSANARIRPPRDNERGVSMIEAAIFLPLLFVAIFIVIGISVMANARMSLGSAMTEAARLAATRGDIESMGAIQLIEPVGDYYSPGGSFDDISALITSGGVNVNDAESFFNRCLPFVYNSISQLEDLPPQLVYTMVYINQALRQSIGSSLKFPCVPPGGAPPSPSQSNCATNPGNPSANRGCVGCYLLHPELLNYVSISAAPNPRRFAIRCEYSPSNVFLDPILRGLALLTGSGGSSAAGIVITRDTVFEITSIGG
jgi:hypothetical protein